MSEIKLKAKRKNTDDWLLFGIAELFHGEDGRFSVCVEDVGFFDIIPSTIQPADDPRKQMLDEIRKRVKDFGYNSNDYILVATINIIIDVMEAEL